MIIQLLVKPFGCSKIVDVRSSICKKASTMTKVSSFKDTVITGKIVCRILEDAWRPPTALARLITASGDEYEIRCTEEGKDWLMAQPLNTALTGTIKRGEVVKYDARNQKYTAYTDIHCILAICSKTLVVKAKFLQYFFNSAVP